jgi:triacylglycerol lipase
MGTIVLAHGIFGFGDLLPGFPSLVNYFNGVEVHLGGFPKVFVPSVNPIGSIKERAKQLASAIANRNGLVDPLHIIAHSMGGLDARFLITHLPDVGKRVATLVTIGTPHAGSPVADAFESPLDPLHAHIPPFIMKPLQENAGAMHDLTTDACRQFNIDTPDMNDRVKYFEIAGDTPQDTSEFLLFDLAAEIGKIKGPNDGVVTVESAQRPGRKLFATWPVDHAGEIGWSKAILNVLHPFRAMEAFKEHLARYDAIVAAINTAKGAEAG